MNLPNNVKRTSSFTILFLAMAALMISTVPAAMASPGLGTGTTPTTPVLGSTMTVNVIGTPGSAPNDKVSIRMFEPQTPAITVPLDQGVFTDPCTTAGVMPDGTATYRAWDLYHGAVIAQFEITSGGDVLRVSFGNGAVSQTVTYNAVPIAAANIDDLGAGTWDWKQTAASPSPGTADDVIDVLVTAAPFYTFIACSNESTAASPGTFDDQNFKTQKPVAGTILPINTAALLIAGISTSALWLVPLVAVAAGAFAVIRFQVSRN